MDINEYRNLRPNYNTLSDDYIIESLEKRFKKPFANITYEDLGETNPNISNINVDNVDTSTTVQPLITDKRDDSRLIESTEFAGMGGVADPYNVNRPEPNQLRFMAKGATFGFNDNLEALIRSQIGDRDYDTVLKDIRKDMQQYAKENPESALAAEIAGGIVTPGGITRTAFKQINKLPALARWVLKPLTLSAQGGLYSAGSSDGQNTIMNTTIGAVAAPAFYGGLLAVPGVGKFAYNKAKDLYGNIANKKPLTTAEKTLGRLINEDVATPSSILTAKKGADHLTLAESIGINATDMLRVIGKYPGKARAKIEKFLTNRNEKVQDRVINTTKKLFNVKSSYRDNYNDLMLKQKEISEELYKPILGIPIRLDGELGNLLQNNPAMKTAYTKAYNDLKIDPDFDVKLLDDMFVVDKNGIATLISNKLNVEKANIIKQGLDGILEKFRSNTTGKLELSSKEAQNILKLQRRFLKLIDKQIPEYKIARAAWAGKAKQLEAMELGKSFMKGGSNKDPDLFINRVEELTTDERAAFVLGATKQIEIMINNAINPKTVINRLLKSRSYQQSLKMLFGDSAKGKKQYSTFVNFLKTEAKMGDTANKVLGGSPTAEIMKQMEFADDLIYLATGSQVAQMLGTAGLVGKLAQKADEGWNKFKPTGPNREQMANLLLETNPTKIREILDRASKGRILLSEEDKRKLLLRLARQNQLAGAASIVSAGEGRPGEIYNFSKRNLVNALRN